MAIAGYDADVVRFDGTQEVQVPLTDVYNHHQYLVLGTNETIDTVQNFYLQHTKENSVPCGLHASRILQNSNLAGTNFGGGSGGEFRKTSHYLAAPYRYVVESPQSFISFLHFINTKGLDGKRLIECPCTSARRIDVANGTIDGIKPDPFYCNKEFMEQGNSACTLATYKAGLRCCNDGVFLTEAPDYQAPSDRLVAKFTFHFEDADAETLPASIAGCCDIVGDLNNLGDNYEYDIPRCDSAHGHECVHLATTVQRILRGMQPRPTSSTWSTEHLS